MGITTYNPGTLEVTNKWEYSDFINVQPTNKSQLGSHEFTITVRKERKNDTMKFSSEHRPHLLTEALKYRNQFEKPKEVLVSLYMHLLFCLFLSTSSRYICKYVGNLYRKQRKIYKLCVYICNNSVHTIISKIMLYICRDIRRTSIIGPIQDCLLY